MSPGVSEKYGIHLGLVLPAGVRFDARRLGLTLGDIGCGSDDGRIGEPPEEEKSADGQPGLKFFGHWKSEARESESRGSKGLRFSR